MKKLLLLLLCVPFISIVQTVTPKYKHLYTTSDAGYSGCKDEYTFKKLLKYADEIDNDNFMELLNSSDCIVIPGGIRIRVVKITDFGGRTLVELAPPSPTSDWLHYYGDMKRAGWIYSKRPIWTVSEVLTEN